MTILMPTPRSDFSLLPFIEKLSVLDKDTSTSRRLGTVMRWPQRHLVDYTSHNIAHQDRTQVIILKARQLGISTIVKGIEFTLAMLFDHFRSRTVSHESDSNEHLLSMIQHYYDTFPLRSFYPQRNKAANKLGWEEVGSRMGVITAKNLGGGRSQTVRFLHGSEVGFWPDPGTLMSGLMQAIPKTWFTFVYLESTANGMGNWFQTTWDEAVARRNDYTPMFFPWQTHPEYVGTHIGIDPVDPKTLTEPEHDLVRFFLDDRLGEENIAVLSRSMTNEQLNLLRGPMTKAEAYSRIAWSRYVKRNELAERKDRTADPDDLFLQEYPHRPTVAFLATGHNIYKLTHLEKVYKPSRPRVGHLLSIGGRIEFRDDPLGPFKVFRPPHPNRDYVIGGDPSFTLGGDYACAQVIDARTLEQIAVWRGKCDGPGEFGDIMCRLGYFYNEALIAPETNRDGATTIGRIHALAYPNIWQRQIVDSSSGAATNKEGWFSSARTKPEALGHLLAVITDGSAIIRDSETYSELKNYVKLGNGKYGNANGSENDDTVMALAIAHTILAYDREDYFTPVEQLSEDLDEMVKTVNAMMGQTGRVAEGLASIGGSGDW